MGHFGASNATEKCVRKNMKIGLPKRWADYVILMEL
jgi:hypothetical protein